MSDPDYQSPLERYKNLIRSGAILPDPEQEVAVHGLDLVYNEIMALRGRQRRPFLKKLMSLGREEKNIKGVYMHGGVGRGKSMLMELFYDSLPPDIKKRRVHFHKFMIEVHEYLHERRMDSDELGDVDSALPALAALISQRSQVLCFDEFHVTDVADAMILGRLFTTLLGHGLIVVSTSNWMPDDLYEGGLQRERFLPFIALLKERMDVVFLDSPHDYRQKSEAEDHGYFYPLGLQADSKMDALFEDLSGGVKVSSDVLDVKGRKIEVEAVAGGVARFSFAQLCERPHGAEDYIKIAKKYHTVFLEHIPKLAYDRRNEAKRLMILVDALYEAGTKLIISAEVPADALYQGHDHAFEFDRTISRLNEMGGKDYLEK